MSDAYVETTVLTDILLKPKTPKKERAQAALARYPHTLLPERELSTGNLDGSAGRSRNPFHEPVKDICGARKQRPRHGR